MINIIAVEDEVLTREVLHFLFESLEDIQLLSCAANGQEAVQHIKSSSPDVVLMDVNMPVMNGVNSIQQIKAYNPDIKVILLYESIEEETVIEGLSAGADGFLLKRLDIEHVARAIRDAHQEQVVISGEISRMLARRIAEIQYTKKDVLKRKLEARQIDLTPRQLDVAYCLLDNMTNHDIADELFLSDGTVKNYISHLYDKTAIKRRNELVNFLRYVLN